VSAGGAGGGFSAFPKRATALRHPPHAGRRRREFSFGDGRAAARIVDVVAARLEP